MPYLSDYLSAKSPVYGAARRKYGLAPDMLVTPPGLDPRNRLRTMFGPQPGMTVPLSAAAPAPAPEGPFAAPGAASAFAARWNMKPDQSIPGPAPHGSQAFVVNRPDGGQHVRLWGSPGGAPTMDMEKRNAYLGGRNLEMAFRRGGAIGDLAADYIGAEGRPMGVVDYAAQRGADRRARLAARKAGPSQLDMLAARNPALALRLMELQQRGAIAQGEMGLRRYLGEGQIGMEGRRLGVQETLGLQQSADRRYGLDIGSRESGLDRAMKERIAKQESEDAVLGAAVTAGVPGAQSILQRRLMGSGKESALAMGVEDLPLETQSQVEQLEPQQAAAVLRQQGASPGAVRRYLQQRARPTTTQSALNVAHNAPLYGFLPYPPLGAANVAGDLATPFVAPFLSTPPIVRSSRGDTPVVPPLTVWERLQGLTMDQKIANARRAMQARRGGR
jgi:hypothetical protein